MFGAVSEFEKAMIVSKLKGARDRKRATGVKVEGRRNYLEINPTWCGWRRNSTGTQSTDAADPFGMCQLPSPRQAT
jgi:hypothetical protein